MGKTLSTENWRWLKMMNKQCNEKVIEHELWMVEILPHHVCKQDGAWCLQNHDHQIHTFLKTYF